MNVDFIPPVINDDIINSYKRDKKTLSTQFFSNKSSLTKSICDLK